MLTSKAFVSVVNDSVSILHLKRGEILLFVHVCATLLCFFGFF